MSVEPAHICASPPANSFVNLWKEAANDSENLFKLTYSLGAIIDVCLDIRLVDSVNVGVTAGTFTPFGKGALFVKYLDGLLATTVGELKPTDYVNICPD